MKILPRYLSYAALLSALLLSSCNRFEEDLSGGEIKLRAVLSSELSAVQTKGEGEITSKHNDELQIGLARIDEKEDATIWPSFKGEGLEFLTATMKPGETTVNVRDIAFDTYQTYVNADDSIRYASWYPSGKEGISTDASAGTVTFPIDGSTDIMYGSVAKGSQSKAFNVIEFNHALTKYTIKAYAMEPEDKEHEHETADGYWGQITDIIIGDVQNTMTMSLPDGYDDKYEFSFTSKDGVSRELCLSQVQGSDSWDAFVELEKFPVGLSNAEVVGRLLAPPASGAGLGLKVKTSKMEEGETSQTLTITRNFEPGKHYVIVLRFTSHGQINAEVVTADWNDGEELEIENKTEIYYDLSEQQTANCYIVSSANYNYCFDATVKGNGESGILGIQGMLEDFGADYHILSPKKAKIIWSDSGVKEDIDLFADIVEGKVMFRLKGKESKDDHSLVHEGNVLVGVYSDDEMTDLLWTWHLWITDRPREQGYKNGFSVMDRDLGATAYDPDEGQDAVNGLYYQWGRPTPFPFNAAKSDALTDVVDSEGDIVDFSVGTSSATDSKSDLSNRISHPTVFYENVITAGKDDKYKPNLWGWRSETDEYAKTIYDPCPQGYRLPSYRLWRDLAMKDDASVTEDNVAIKFTIDVNNEVVYYPISGYYINQGDNLQHITDYSGEEGAFMWSATYDITDKKPYYLDFSLEGSELGNLQYYSNFQGLAAMPVRCISRMSKAHVTDLSDYQTANSYIVSKDGYYKFKATVRGNGVGELVSTHAGESIILTEGLSVDISDQLVDVKPLWWQGDLSKDWRKPENGAAPTVPLSMLNEGKPDNDGYVSFEIENYCEGNMVLAGYDVRGNIIWTWHIWLTDEPQMKKSNQYVVMDRNLGATFAPGASVTSISDADLAASYGFYYQWGRKDPFVGTGSASDWYLFEKTGNLEAGWKSNVAANTAVVTEKDVPNSVANPVRFHATSVNLGEIPDILSYTNGSRTNTAAAQCMSTMQRQGSRSSLWGYSAMEGAFGLTTTKTMYDPCPPGYCVSYYLVWSNVEGGNSPYAYRDNYEGTTVSLSNSNVNFISSGTDNKSGIMLQDSRFDPTWYPYTGYIIGNSTITYEGQGGQGRFHSATPAGLGSRSLYYTESVSGQAVSSSYIGLPSTYAYPVRCQKE